MGSAFLTKDEVKAYRTFNWLRKYTEGVNVEILKQISVYLARSNDEFNVHREAKISLNSNNNYYVLFLNDGRKFVFPRRLDNFEFFVTKRDSDVSMFLFVHELESGNLSSTNVYGEIKVKEEGMYVVAFRPNDLSDDSLKYGTINYYTKDEIDWVLEVIDDNIDYDFDIVVKNNLIYPFAEKSYFDILPQRDLKLDIFDGYISGAMMRTELLFNNIKTLNNTKKLTKRKSK